MVLDSKSFFGLVFHRLQNNIGLRQEEQGITWDLLQPPLPIARRVERSAGTDGGRARR